MIKETKDYIRVTEQIKANLKHSPYKISYIISQLDMAESTFYYKLKNNSFTPTEVLLLCKYIETK